MERLIFKSFVDLWQSRWWKQALQKTSKRHLRYCFWSRSFRVTNPHQYHYTQIIGISSAICPQSIYLKSIKKSSLSWKLISYCMSNEKINIEITRTAIIHRCLTRITKGTWRRRNFSRSWPNWVTGWPRTMLRIWWGKQILMVTVKLIMKVILILFVTSWLFRLFVIW